MEEHRSLANPRTTYDLELTRQERWIVHTLMLDRLGFGPGDDDPPNAFVCTLAVVEKIERDRSDFSRLELDQIRLACERYTELAATPDEERARTERIIERIEGTTRSVPKVSQ